MSNPAPYAVLHLVEHGSPRVIPWLFFQNEKEAHNEVKAQKLMGNHEATVVKLYQPGADSSLYVTPTTAQDFSLAKSMWEEGSSSYAETIYKEVVRVKAKYRKSGYKTNPSGRKAHFNALRTVADHRRLSMPLVEAIYKVGQKRQK